MSHIPKNPKLGQVEYDLIARVADLEAFSGGKTTARMDLYVSDINGDDTNPGTADKPLKTVIEAEKRLPDIIEHPVIVHVGAHDSDHYVMPTFRSRFLRDSIYVIGDGAGQGTDGFTELKSEDTAQAGSSNTTVVTSGGLSTDEFLGKTIEILSGAAKGDRRTIQKNDTTDITVGIKFSSEVAEGDKFRVVEPEISIVWPEIFIQAQPGVVQEIQTMDKAPSISLINFKRVFHDITYTHVHGPLRLFGFEEQFGPIYCDLTGSVTTGLDEIGKAFLGESVFGTPNDESWYGWSFYSTRMFVMQALHFAGAGIVANTGVNNYLVGTNVEVIGGRLIGDVHFGSLASTSLFMTGDKRGSDHVLIIEGQLRRSSVLDPSALSHVYLNSIEITHNGDAPIRVEGYEIQLAHNVTINTDSDGVVAEFGGRVYLNSNTTINATGAETKVIDVEGADVTRAIADYTSVGSYIASGDGSVIQREL